MSAAVARFESDARDGQYEATVHIVRTSMHVLEPPLADVPADVRAALLRWLDGNPKRTIPAASP